jgi:tungstate transport system permease protein
MWLRFIDLGGEQRVFYDSYLHEYVFISTIDRISNKSAKCAADENAVILQGVGGKDRLGAEMSGDASAIHLVLTGDPALVAIVWLSLIVSMSATLFAAVIGVPIGAFMALTRFPGREGAIVVLNALMGLPPVVVGLAIYVALSRSGPLGSWGLLFTPQAMVIAQTVLVAPIIAALTRQTIEDLWAEYRDELAALNVGPLRRIATLIWDARFSLVTALLAGFGRAAAEVGAIIIVGGNIDGFTRTMTTAIALETSKGDLPLAIGLGMVLISIVVAINALAWGARRAGERYAG